MTNDASASKITVPPGWELVPDGQGGHILQQTDAVAMNRVVSFRLPDADYAAILPFIESFPQRSWSVAFRWIVRHPEVRRVMAEKIRQQHKHE